MSDRPPSPPDRLSTAESAVLGLLRAVPRAAVSRAAGRLAGLRLPRPLRAPAMRAFGGAVGVDFTEVRDPLGSFAALQDFFTRHLADGVRPVDPAPDAVVAPCDGAWGESGTVSGGTLLQVKGKSYRLADLFGARGGAGGWFDPTAFEGGTFATLYLSPRDYHRFHAPVAARIEVARYLPGTLWPVNRVGLLGVDGLFARNERVLLGFGVGSEAADERPSGRLVYIAVGATMVGKVHVEVDAALTTNVRGAERVERAYTPPVAVGKGDEVGRFEFGSTLVLVATPGLLTLDAEPTGTPLRLGRRIGTLAG